MGLAVINKGRSVLSEIVKKARGLLLHEELLQLIVLNFIKSINTDSLPRYFPDSIRCTDLASPPC
jgi:hypothetical protein